jgi:hypothetical protein
VKQCIVATGKTLIGAATEAVQSDAKRVEASQRLIELATYDAQLATLHLGAELLYRRTHPQKVDLLWRWAPERVREFLDLSEAMEPEATRLEWKRAEFSPSSSAPSIPQVATPKLMSVPLRSTAEIPMCRAIKPYPERDWFRKRSATLAGNVAQRLAKDKSGLTRFLTEGAG